MTDCLAPDTKNKPGIKKSVLKAGAKQRELLNKLRKDHQKKPHTDSQEESKHSEDHSEEEDDSPINDSEEQKSQINNLIKAASTVSSKSSSSSLNYLKE